MNIAVNVVATSRSHQDLDLEDEEDFKVTLRDLCELFVSVLSKKIYFLYQTARVFLIRELSPLSEASAASPVWKHSITIRGAHAILAESCIRYLSFHEFEDIFPQTTDGSPDFESFDLINGLLENNHLLRYATDYCAFHVRHAQEIDKTLDDCHLELCNLGSSLCWSWFQVSQYTGKNFPSIKSLIDSPT
jgi:hypothetical protein